MHLPNGRPQRLRQPPGGEICSKMRLASSPSNEMPRVFGSLFCGWPFNLTGEHSPNNPEMIYYALFGRLFFGPNFHRGKQGTVGVGQKFRCAEAVHEFRVDVELQVGDAVADAVRFRQAIC